MLALFIEKPTPFLAEVLERVTGLDYPKHRMRLWVHTLVGTVCGEGCGEGLCVVRGVVRDCVWW